MMATGAAVRGSPLADEQAALRRVATLVAQGVPPAEIFAAVSIEVDRVFGLDPATFDVAVVGRFEPGPELVIVGISKSVDIGPVGSRWPPNELFAPTHVLRTGRPARIRADDVVAASGEVAELLRDHGYLSQVASPIVVDGNLWGAMLVTTKSDLPPDTEERLAQFTELVATAIANAESHEALAKLADEQAALQRVATLVAQGVSSGELFAAVTTEVAHVFSDVDASLVATVIRFDPGPECVLVGGSRPYEREPLGARWAPRDLYVSTRVLRSGSSARVNEADLDAIGGPVADVLRLRGFLHQVGCPVVVEGQLWGAMTLNSSRELPPDTDARLEKFTELVATAIANADSRGALAELAGEQAALRRVATLVAEGAPPDEVFAAVVDEVARILGLERVGMSRYEADGTATVIGATGEHPYPPGSRSALNEPSLLLHVRKTGRPARIDDYRPLPGTMAAAAHEAGVRSAIGTPIIVDGRTWGAIIAISTEPRPIPDRSELRLAQFTDLVATAVANATAHTDLSALADEQTALRRVATLVARGAPAAEIFSAVAEEVGGLLGPDHAVMARFDGPDVVSIMAEWTSTGDRPRLENRRPLSAGGIAKLVQDTGRPARVDDYVSAARGRQSWVLDSGTRAAVAAPITVDGRLWGVMGVGSRGAPPPPGTEARLASFTELVATAIANTEARHALERAAAQQAALRRVATLVAQAAAPQDLFDAVAEEVGRLLPAANVSMGRYESDDTVTSMASWSFDGPTFPVGVRWPIKGTNAAWMVLQTGRSARVDDFSTATDPIGVAVREAGYTSAVGSPIVVEGQLWGVISAASTEGRMPPDSEERLASFTELVATALANAEARAQVERLAEEQAALRRVATLVAGGAEPREIFSAVSDEVGRLFDTKLAAVGRFELDAGSVRTFFSLGAPLDLVGTDRWEVVDYLATADVLRTGRSARAEAARWESEEGETAERLRRLGVITTVASPIVVEGELWGAMLVASTDAQLPGDTEERLERFTELVATAIANAESSAELSASRRRIVAAADDARRRIERDLHDGVQQRLVSLGLELGVMKADPPIGDALKEQLASATDDVRSVLDAIVELARGIHPAILSRGGLEAALKALARRSVVPVELHAEIDGPLPGDVEVAAYYVAAEALTNAAKHAHASVARMDARTDDGTLTLTVRDDGVGGAKPGGGSGLIGLRDRVEALGGTIKITSSAGNGTSIAVTLPIATEPDGEIDPFLGQP